MDRWVDDGLMGGWMMDGWMWKRVSHLGSLESE